MSCEKAKIIESIEEELLRYIILFLFLYLSSVELIAKGSMKTCETLSDLHCRQFWSEDNQGNLNIGDEKILLGKSTRSEVDASDLVDHQAFISSYEKLPSDAKVALASLVEELKQHLGKESFKNSWKRKLAIIDYQIRSTIKDVAENRTFQRRPDLQLKGKRKEDKKFIDHHELAKDLFELKSELLRAKYEKHPNWLRVQRIFKRAQKDVIQVIEELIGAPIFILSTSPERDDTILLKDPFYG